MRRPLKREDVLKIEEYAKEAVKLYPREMFKEEIALSPEEWIKESYRLAIDVAYDGIKPYDIPAKEYEKKTRKCVIKRIALAGYRLADILNKIF